MVAHLVDLKAFQTVVLKAALTGPTKAGYLVDLMGEKLVVSKESLMVERMVVELVSLKVDSLVEL